jgi:hypothetical protein
MKGKKNYCVIRGLMLVKQQVLRRKELSCWLTREKNAPVFRVPVIVGPGSVWESKGL